MFDRGLGLAFSLCLAFEPLDNNSGHGHQILFFQFDMQKNRIFIMVCPEKTNRTEINSSN